MALTKRLVKGSALTAAEHDDNLDFLLVASGTITPRDDDLDLSGGSDGHVLTVQGDGSAAFEALPSFLLATAFVTSGTITPRSSGNLDFTGGLDGYVWTVQSGGNVSFEALPTRLANVVEDTSPQLGANLDLNSFTVGDASATALTKLSELTATSTELNYVDGVTSAIQTQIDGKETLFATVVESGAAVNIDNATHKDKRIHLTHATPVVTVRDEATHALDAGFKCMFTSVNDATLTFAAGVDGNGSTASSWSIQERPSGLTLFRDAEDDFSVIGATEEL